MCFLPSGYQHGRADNQKSCVTRNGEKLQCPHAISDVRFNDVRFSINTRPLSALELKLLARHGYDRMSFVLSKSKRNADPWRSRSWVPMAFDRVPTALLGVDGVCTALILTLCIFLERRESAIRTPPWCDSGLR